MSSLGVQAVEGERTDHAILLGREVNARENLASLPGYSPSPPVDSTGVTRYAMRMTGMKSEPPEDRERELIVLALSGKCSNRHCPYPDSRVTIGPDPYASEIRGDDTPVALCADCRADRAQEV
jgi:hypothetical protein